MTKKILFILFYITTSVAASAQIGEHRNSVSIGVNGGYNLSSVSFTPTVTQKTLPGITGGIVVRYTCEKYFSTICSIQGELNFSQIGWRQDIRDMKDNPVINPASGVAEEYDRAINYIQIPLFAHLAWGREKQGFNFFINLGPQFGIYTSEKTTATYDLNNPNLPNRANPTVAQETMPVENKFDYGIAAGGGIECHIKHIGRFLAEARYYYGLGNIYGDSKRDYFGGSNHSVITIKAAYLIDL